MLRTEANGGLLVSFFFYTKELTPMTSLLGAIVPNPDNGVQG